MIWRPDERWTGEDVFIIGGGPSLNRFDFNLLKGKRTIGCNAAFSLGSEIVSVLYFTDTSFWEVYKEDILSNFQGDVITSALSLENENHDRLKWVPRKRDGLHPKGHAIGWNYSTGASAIDLALRFGASRVFLLGVDLKLGQKRRMNWHSDRPSIRRDHDSLFSRFRKGFERVARDLPEAYPGRSVIQVNNRPPLNCFGSMSFKELEAMLNPSVSEKEQDQDGQTG